MNKTAFLNTQINGQSLHYRGKVRDVFDLGEHLLIVVTDRISAFDVVFQQGVAERGKLLTAISNHWFSLIDFVDNHLVETNAKKFPQPFAQYAEVLDGRSVLVKKAKRIDFECVVRGYLMGSGFKEYQKNQEICGEKIPSGLQLGDPLLTPLFTPATKADSGHDENVSFDFMAKELGTELAQQLKDLSLKIFAFASQKLLEQNIILADTKFEFGILNDKIILIDEVLTPDSSRFWNAQQYQEAKELGKQPQSMDKQVLRDYLETLDWNKEYPSPQLPAEVLQKTYQQYNTIKKEVLCITK